MRIFYAHNRQFLAQRTLFAHRRLLKKGDVTFQQATFNESILADSSIRAGGTIPFLNRLIRLARARQSPRGMFMRLETADCVQPLWGELATSRRHSKSVARSGRVIMATHVVTAHLRVVSTSIIPRRRKSVAVSFLFFCQEFQNIQPLEAGDGGEDRICSEQWDGRGMTCRQNNRRIMSRWPFPLPLPPEYYWRMILAGIVCGSWWADALVTLLACALWCWATYQGIIAERPPDAP